MSVVQPVLVTELVVVLVLRGVWIRQDVAAAWVSVLVVCLAVAEFFIAAEPTGGHPVPETKEWLAAGLVFGAAIAVLAAVGWPTGPPARRLCRRGRAHLGLGGDLPQGRDHTLTAFGIAGMFTRWQVYALIAAGVAGTLLEQAACVGPLSVSQPTLFIVNPFASIILSVWLFDSNPDSRPGIEPLAVVLTRRPPVHRAGRCPYPPGARRLGAGASLYEASGKHTDTGRSGARRAWRSWPARSFFSGTWPSPCGR
jgi:hypothetical protein